MDKDGINEEIDGILDAKGATEDGLEQENLNEKAMNEENPNQEGVSDGTQTVEDGEEFVDNFDADVDKALTKSEPSEDELLDNGIKQAIFVDKNDERVDNLWANREEDTLADATPVESMDNLERVEDLGANAQELLLIKKKKQWAAMLFAIIVVFCISLYFWISNVYRGDVAIAYAKDNAVYVYNLKDAPDLANDTISDNGDYHYFYSAWGARFSEDGEHAYYLANQNANQVGDLYEWDVEEKTETLIDTDVIEFTLEIEKRDLLYVKAENNTAALYYYNGESRFVASDITDANAPYGLAQENAFAYYATNVNGQISLHAYDLEAQEDIVLSETLETCIPADKQNTLYYVSNEDEQYILYGYTFGLKPKKVLKEGVYVTYFEVLPNEKSLLYCTSGENVKYSDLVEDDMTDDTQTNAQAQIKEAMQSGQSIQTPLQSTYLLENNSTIKLEKSVIAITAMQDKSGFMIGYSTNDFQKLKLSELESIEDVDYQYYLSLLSSEKNIFYADATGNFYEVSNASADLTTMTVTTDGSRIAYLATDDTTGETVLISEVVGKPESAVTVATNVESMTFLTDSHILMYYYDYAGGVGRVETWKDGKTNEVSTSANGLYVADDATAVYFIENMDMTSGNGTLCVYENSEKKVLGKNVFSFQYKGRKKLATIVNYDINTQIGDLYYYNGKKPVLVDTDITAIFVY